MKLKHDKPLSNCAFNFNLRHYTEDKLVRAYYNRHPTAKFLPIDLMSDKPHFVRAFALRQLALMQGGTTERDALRMVEKEAMEEERNVGASPGPLGHPFPPHSTPPLSISLVSAQPKLSL